MNWKDRIAIVSDEASRDFAEALKMCLPLGIRFYDLRQLGQDRVPFVKQDELEKVDRLLAQTDVKISGISPGFFKIPLSDSTWKDQLSKGLDASFRLMERFGTERLTIFTFKREAPEAPIPEEVYERLSKAIERCHSVGYEPLIENVPSCWGNTGARLAEIAERLNIRLVWDPANAPVSGEEAFPYGYSKVRDHLALIHIRNWKPDQGYVYFDEGVVDMTAQVHALVKDAYKGLFCIESHRWEDPLATETNHRQLLKALESAPSAD